jgi:hypothetical protein
LLLLFSCKKPTEPPPPPPTGPDTTSHNFTWQIDTLGYSGVLYDVAIIDENNIWAVGEIFLKDSSGQVDPTAYSLAKWDGVRWNLQRIYYQSGASQNIVAPIRGIWRTAANEVWLAAGSVFRWEGSSSLAQLSLSRLTLGDPNASVEKLGGTSNNNLYGVGNSGTIVHFNGSSWQKVESGTSVDFRDVWGSPDGSVVWACGFTDFVGTVLLRFQGTNIQKVYEDADHWFQIRQDSLSGVLTSVWTDKAEKVYVVTPAGMYECPSTTRGNGIRKSFTDDFLPGFPQRIRGSGENDIFLVGDFTMLAHYNGKTWRYYEELRRRIRLRSVAMKRNRVLAVGIDLDESKPVVLMGLR